ncbi:MAG: heme-binding protein [Nitrospinae bacterium]|nr:heme-binding protein [Nitrospinota bacterium]
MKIVLGGKSLFVFGLALGLLSLTASPSLSQELIQEKSLPLSLAQKAANAAREKCEADGYKISVAVVDGGGNLKALVRGDGAGPHTIDSSSKKAYTSASLRRSTRDMAEMIAKNPAIQALGRMNDKILILGGGLPIKFGEAVLGGIGVGGAPGGHLDEACAVEGLKSIGASVPGEKKE